MLCMIKRRKKCGIHDLDCQTLKLKTLNLEVSSPIRNLSTGQWAAHGYC